MDTVAMLVDWENIKKSTWEYLGTAPDIVTLKKIARQYGKLTIARAYAHWTDPNGWHAGDVERLSAQGVEPVFVWTRRENRYKEEPTYVSDMADLRLACDCMELLAMHPEISCYVVVSGDGALETVIAKLSAYGKRIVRIAVEKSLAKGMHVLGEERVLYDDWVKGFKLPVVGGPIQNALDEFVEAVRTLRVSGADNGLQTVKEVMRRNNPKFEEEQLGIPTFRHLAYLAEARSLVRIDSRPEPARAYLADEENAIDGAFLPTGGRWLELIKKVGPKREYNRDGIQLLLENTPWFDAQYSSPKRGVLFVYMAIISGVIGEASKPVMAGWDKPTEVFSLRLNTHHPRVQVALAISTK